MFLLPVCIQSFLFVSVSGISATLCGGFGSFFADETNKTTMEEILKKTNSSLPVETPVDRVGALQPVDEQQTVHNPYFKLETGLKEIFGEEFELSDSLAQDLLLQHLRVNKEQNARLAGAMQRDPRMAQLLADMIEGKRNAHSAVARYFGRSVMEVDENSPEFDEIMLADEERREEVANLANDRREYEENLAESIPVIEQFCVQKGYDPSDFMSDVWEKLIFPVLAGRYSSEVCTLLDHAITYEKDVEDAFAAGDVKGRNTNIMRMKEDFGDGLPKGMSSAAPVVDKRIKRNSLIEKALKA